MKGDEPVEKKQTKGLTLSPLAILDVGCGRHPVGTVNVDFNLSSLRAIDWGNPSGIIDMDVDLPKPGEQHFVLADAHHLPFRDSCFDIIHSNHVIEHLKHPIDALREQHRVLKTLGKVYVTTPNWLSPCSWFNMQLKPNPFIKVSREHLHHFTLASFRRTIQESGLRPVSIRGRMWLGWQFLAKLSARFRRIVYLPPQLADEFRAIASKDGVENDE